MQLMALRKKAEGSAPPERKPGRRLTVRRGAALLLVLALAAGAALGGKALFFSGEEQTPLTEQTTYGSLSTTLSGTGTTMPTDSVTYTTASEAEITGVYVSAGEKSTCCRLPHSTIRPSRSTRTRSARAETTEKSWLTRRIAV